MSNLCHCFLFLLCFSLFSCNIYKFDTLSIVESAERNVLKIEEKKSYSLYESKGMYYLEVSGHYVPPPHSIIKGFNPILPTNGNDEYYTWRFPSFSEPTPTNSPILCVYIPLTELDINQINSENGINLKYEFQPNNTYNNILLSLPASSKKCADIGKTTVDSIVYDKQDITDRYTYFHYVAAPISLIAWGIDTVSLIPCTTIGWLVYEMPNIFLHSITSPPHSRKSIE